MFLVGKPRGEAPAWTGATTDPIDTRTSLPTSATVSNWVAVMMLLKRYEYVGF